MEPRKILVGTALGLAVITAVVLSPKSPRKVPTLQQVIDAPNPPALFVPSPSPTAKLTPSPSPTLVPKVLPNKKGR